MSAKPTLLCLAGFEKGAQFLEGAHRAGARILLVTGQSLQDSSHWPRHAIDEIFFMPDPEKSWNLEHLVLAVAHLNRRERIHRVIGLDDFDQEKAALLREHFRWPGMGESQTRFFRDKLAMRKQAAASGIAVPAFTGVSHLADIAEFVDSVPGPWILKPRLYAGAIGIKKCENREEIWSSIDNLGDRQSYFVLEQFVPGDIFHVDSLWWRGEPVACFASAYGTPPLEVAHGGGIFTSSTLPPATRIAMDLRSLNTQVLQAFGLKEGVSHTEFIRARDGRLLFLETSCRVGGAYISDLIQAGSGLNLWAEWGAIETAMAAQRPYCVPDSKSDHAGLLLSLAREEWPDTSSFDDPEIVRSIRKPFHVGFVLRSPDPDRIRYLLAQYYSRVLDNFHASAPAPDRPMA